MGAGAEKMWGACRAAGPEADRCVVRFSGEEVGGRLCSGSFVWGRVSADTARSVVSQLSTANFFTALSWAREPC